MIASFENGFLFVKGRKVAGTSVETVLSTVCSGKDVVTPITPRDEVVRLHLGGRPMNFAADPKAEAKFINTIREAALDDLSHIKIPKVRFHGHMPLDTVRRKLHGTQPLEVVYVTRNPYAKILSMANHVMSFHRYRGGGGMSGSSDELRERVERMLADGRFEGAKNISIYRDIDGTVSGRQLRYEQLAVDLAIFAEDFGLRLPPLPHAKKGAASNQLEWRQFFTRDELDTINEQFADEFEAFGYERI